MTHTPKFHWVSGSMHFLTWVGITMTISATSGKNGVRPYHERNVTQAIIPRNSEIHVFACQQQCGWPSAHHMSYLHESLFEPLASPPCLFEDTTR